MNWILASCILVVASLSAFSQTAPAPVAGDLAAKKGVKPLWVFDGKPFEEPSRPEPLLNFAAATASGQLVFTVAGTYKDKEAKTEVVVIKGKSAEVLKKVVFPIPAPVTNHWIPGTATAGGEQVLICMVQWREDENKKRRATMILRKFDASTGTFPVTKTMSFSDPAQSTESGPVSWPGSQCVRLRADGQQIYMATPYFVAVLDGATLNLVKSRMLPPELHFAAPEFHPEGIKWSLIRKEATKYWTAEPGAEPVEIGKTEYEALPPVETKAAARVNKEGKFLEVAKSKDSPWSRVEIEVPDSLQWVRPEFSTGKICLVKVVADQNFYVAAPLE